MACAPTTSRADVKWALEQDKRPTFRVEIYTQELEIVALAKAFNFESDGSITPGQDIQDADQLFMTTAMYIDRYNDADDEADAAGCGEVQASISAPYQQPPDDFLVARPAAVTIATSLAFEGTSTISPDEIFVPYSS